MSTSTHVASQSTDMAFTEQILYARKALAASLESSSDHRLVVTMFSSDTQ